MFIIVKDLRYNFDNVVAYWKSIRKEERHTSTGVEIEPRYFIHIQHINDCDFLEFDTEEELNEVIDMLDRELKLITK